MGNHPTPDDFLCEFINCEGENTIITNVKATVVPPTTLKTKIDAWNLGLDMGVWVAWGWLLCEAVIGNVVMVNSQAFKVCATARGDQDQCLTSMH
jgi:hypothetical protein